MNAHPRHTHASPHAHTHIDGAGVATLTLTGAKSLNILGTPAIRDLTDAITTLRARDDVRVLILRGAGDKAFIGGADIHEMAELDPVTAKIFIRGLRDLCEAIRAFPTPVVARLSGWCLGGGLEVAAACDLRIADEGARFGMPEVNVGIPSVIHAALLPRLIGVSRATWLVTVGENVDAVTAHSWGLVQKLAPLGELDAAVEGTAHTLAALGPDVVRQQKRLLRSWEERPLEEAIAESVEAFGHAFSTGEPQKYMTRFKNRKRAGHQGNEKREETQR